MRLLLGALIALGLVVVPASADAAGKTGYGQQATVIASEVGCHRARVLHPQYGDVLDRSVAACVARGVPMVVVTFGSYPQEATWIRAARIAYPRATVVAVAGIVAFGHHPWGNKAGAIEAKRMLGHSGITIRF